MVFAPSCRSRDRVGRWMPAPERRASGLRFGRPQKAHMHAQRSAAKVAPVRRHKVAPARRIKMFPLAITTHLL
jgi:hypothetical protein